MNFYTDLMTQTEDSRNRFLAIPIIRQTLEEGVSMDLYVAYLMQAYHHVKHTCNLLALAASRCGTEDRPYQDALFDYIDEEKGHDLWILDDISALGGDAERVRAGEPEIPCAVMIGYAYYAIEHISPYSLLGMVHVLEGMSVALAQSAATSIAGALDRPINDGGFQYLTSHGALDQDHVAFFEKLVKGINNQQHQQAIISTANVMYELFGGIFDALGRFTAPQARHEA